MNKYMVIDAESVGLHGETFAIGWVVVDESGQELDAKCYACPPGFANDDGIDSGVNLQWVRKHVKCKTTHKHPIHVRHAFWEAWSKWKMEGALLVADCAWPVEARLLIQCMLDFAEESTWQERQWEGPYPLHEVATARLLAGFDPLATEERLPNELPAHNPLNDARQSARLWLDAINKIKHDSWLRDQVVKHPVHTVDVDLTPYQ